MKDTRKTKVIVVANDAGGAEAMVPYLSAHDDRYRFIVFAAGPAKRVFEREGIETRPIEDDEKRIARKLLPYEDAAFALLGTGWMTLIERRALLALKEARVRTIVFLESWEHYRERFGYPDKDWKRCLPDEIWVGDDVAKRMAERLLPGIPVRKKRENYLDSMKKRYREARKKTRKDEVLFLSVCVPGATPALETLLRVAAKKGKRVAVRFHPADAKDRYDGLIARYRSRVAIRKSNEKEIVRDLARATTVVGTETVAMALSVHLSIPTVSLGKVGKKRFLPFPEIVKARSASALERLI